MLLNPKLYDYQKAEVLRALQRGRWLFNSECGNGKAKPLNSLVLTPTGWQELGSLRVGDLTIGSDGKSTEVVGVYPQGVRDIYKITFSNHETSFADGEHAWSVNWWAGRPGNYYKLHALVTTKQIFDQVKIPVERSGIRGGTFYKTLNPKKLYIPMLSAPVEFTENVGLPVPPYLLGALVANGCLLESTTLTVNTHDFSEVLGRIPLEYLGKQRDGVGCVAVGILGLLPLMRELKLNVKSGLKFIPEIYLRASVEDRIALLQGLMDCDGSCSKIRNKVVYHTTSQKLAHDVVDLVECLGGIASVRTYDRSHEDKSTEYQVRMRLPVSIKPFSIKRKAERYTGGVAPCRTFQTIEHVGQAETVCIKVAAEDGLFVVEHCIVTHNTPSAIECLRIQQAKRVLIIAPAVVTHNWIRELDKWYPGHPEVVAHRWGKNNKSTPKYAKDWYDKPYQIVSYGMAKDVRQTDWDAIILDECHRLQTPTSSQSKVVRAICRNNPTAAIFGLTATIMPNEPIDVWNPIDTIFPGFFGHSNGQRAPWKFCERYCGKVENAYAIQGYAYKGINEFYAEELKQKLSTISSRTTKAEVAHLLPAYCVQSLFIKPEKKSKYAAASASALTKEDLDAALRLSGQEKLDHVVEWVEDALSGTTHIAIMCYFRDTVRAVASALEARGHHCVQITGELAASDRFSQIQSAITRPGKTILVATMKSCGIGIDLTRFSQALFAELYYSPEVMEQALGRFSRLSGTVPSNVTLMIMENTLDERIAFRLTEKLAAINSATVAGATSTTLQTILGKTDDFIESLLDKLPSQNDTTGYF